MRVEHRICDRCGKDYTGKFYKSNHLTIHPVRYDGYVETELPAMDFCNECSDEIMPGIYGLIFKKNDGEQA